MRSYSVSKFGLITATIIASSSHAGINTFTPTGPNGGWSSTVYYIPGSAGVALATNADGLFRTTDNGLSWRRVFGNILNASQRLIATDPRNSNHIVFQAEQHGIQLSDDAGMTFKSIGAYPPQDMTNAEVMAYSRNGLVVYALFETKVLRSFDGGATWTRTAADLPTTDFIFTNDLAISPNDQDTVYVSLMGMPQRVYKTTNGGQSWITLGLARGFEKLAINPNASNFLLGAGYSGIMRSTDGGDNWSSVSGESISLIKFDPLVIDRVFAVSVNGKIMRSIDGGVNWTTLADLKTFQPLSLSFDTTKAGRMMYGSADGILVSEDGGVNWEARNAGLFGGVWFLTTHRASRSIFATGDPSPMGLFTRDVFGNWNSLGLASMQSITGIPQPVAGVRALAIGSDDAKVIYAARSYSLMKSTDSGATWVTASAELKNDAVLSIAVDPSTSATLYASTSPRGVLRSIDGGVSWTERNNGLLSLDSRFVVVDPKIPSTLYTTTIEPRLYKSINAGLDWNAVTLPVGAAAYYGLQIDPSDSNTIYIATSGGVWRSDNGSASWSKVAEASGDVFDIAIDPDMASVLILNGTAGTSALRRSLDKGATWESIPFPFGNSFLGSVEIDPKNSANILFSAPYNGIYQLEISPDLELKSNSSVVANNTPQTLTMQLTNKGPYGATGLKVSADVPFTAQNVSVQSDKGTCTVTVVHIDCALTMLKKDEIATVTLTLTTATTVGSVTAAVSARESDPVTSNNSLSITPVAPPPPPASTSGGGGFVQWWILMTLVALRIPIHGRKRKASSKNR
jgi:photosystem II stability/assembly factor-like uncharacterized protein